MCSLCNAVRSPGFYSAYNFRVDAAWALTSVTNEVYMRETGQLLVATLLPGWNIGMVQMDLMHILALGLLQVVIGSILFELCQARFFTPSITGPWRERFAYQLEIAFHDVYKCCRLNCIKTSQRQCRLVD